MSRYQIRRARPEDVDSIVVLCAEHAAFEQSHYDPAGKKERLTRCLFAADPPIQCYVAADEAGDLVGYATFAFEFSTWDAERYIHVDCLYLRPEARYRGTAFEMLRIMAKDVVKSIPEGMSSQWQTPPNNSHAIQFYETLGARRKDKARFYIERELVLKIAAA